MNPKYFNSELYVPASSSFLSCPDRGRSGLQVSQSVNRSMSDRSVLMESLYQQPTSAMGTSIISDNCNKDVEPLQFPLYNRTSWINSSTTNTSDLSPVPSRIVGTNVTSRKPHRECISSSSPELSPQLHQRQLVKSNDRVLSIPSRTIDSKSKHSVVHKKNDASKEGSMEKNTSHVVEDSVALKKSLEKKPISEPSPELRRTSAVSNASCDSGMKRKANENLMTNPKKAKLSVDNKQGSPKRVGNGNQPDSSDRNATRGVKKTTIPDYCEEDQPVKSAVKDRSTMDTNQPKKLKLPPVSQRRQSSLHTSRGTTQKTITRETKTKEKEKLSTEEAPKKVSERKCKNPRKDLQVSQQLFSSYKEESSSSEDSTGYLSPQCQVVAANRETEEESETESEEDLTAKPETKSKVAVNNNREEAKEETSSMLIIYVQ